MPAAGRAAGLHPRDHGSGVAVQLDSGAAQSLLGTLASDRGQSEGPGALGDARALSRTGPSADSAPTVRAQSAPHRLPALDLVAGTQAGRVRELLLPRGTVSDHQLPPRLRCVARSH